MNIERALKKLDEFGTMSIVQTSNTPGEMTQFETHKNCTMFELREILLAMKDEPKNVNTDFVSVLGSVKNARLEDIEDRLARLEEAVKLIQFDNDIEPEEQCPSVGEECDVVSHRLGSPCPKCDKPAPAEKECISINRDVAEEFIDKVKVLGDNYEILFFDIVKELRKSLGK